MTIETDSLDYTDSIVNLMIQVTDTNARNIALDLWKYYPIETQLLSTSLIQTQHTKRRAKLEGG
jgi:hypothetical protein